MKIIQTTIEKQVPGANILVPDHLADAFSQGTDISVPSMQSYALGSTGNTVERVIAGTPDFDRLGEQKGVVRITLNFALDALRKKQVSLNHDLDVALDIEAEPPIIRIEDKRFKR